MKKNLPCPILNLEPKNLPVKGYLQTDSRPLPMGIKITINTLREIYEQPDQKP